MDRGQVENLIGGKLIDSEGHARFIGYGGMLMESFVAMMALVAASIIDPGVYFTMNSPAAIIGTTPEVETVTRRRDRP